MVCLPRRRRGAEADGRQKDVERESLSRMNAEQRTSERNVSCSLKRSPSRVSALLPPSLPPASARRRARYLPPILLRRGNSRKRERKGASEPTSQPTSRRTSLAFYRHVRGEGATPLPPTAAARKRAPYAEPEGVDPLPSLPPGPAAAPVIPASSIGPVWLFWPRALQCGWVCLPHEFIILGIPDRTERKRGRVRGKAQKRPCAKNKIIPSAGERVSNPATRRRERRVMTATAASSHVAGRAT